MAENDLDDFDVQDDLAAGPQDGPADQKPTLRDAWQSNPLLKVGAVVVAAAVGIGAYVTITKPNPVEQSVSAVDAGDTSDVKAVPGKAVPDKKYAEAVQKKNVERAKEAANTGGSSLPTSVTTAKTQGLDIPQVSNAGATDPLVEWKRNVQARRIKTDETAVDDVAEAPPQPELVPMVTPITPQPVMKTDPNVAAALAGQMRTIVASQQPKRARVVNVTSVQSQYTKKIAEDKKNEAKAAAEAAARTPAAGGAAPPPSGVAGGPPGALPAGAQFAKEKVITPAGSIAYAQLLTELNSDIPMPVMAAVLSGPFAGGRAMGSMTTKDEYIVITFTRIIKDDVSYTINGIALDEKTTLPAQATDVDHHYFSRIILPAAARFVQDYGSAVAETGTQTETTNGGGVVSSTPKPDAKESIFKGLSGVAATVGGIIQEDAKTKPTIYLARGTTMGILFVDTVKTSDVEE